MHEHTPGTPPHYARAAIICLVAPLVIGGGAQLLGVLGGDSGPAASLATPTTGATSTNQSSGLSMGTLSARDYRVDLIATDQGTRYTIRDRAGNVLAERLTPEEATTYFGGQDPRKFITGAGALMLADEPAPQP